MQPMDHPYLHRGTNFNYGARLLDAFLPVNRHFCLPAIFLFQLVLSISRNDILRTLPKTYV